MPPKRKAAAKKRPEPEPESDSEPESPTLAPTPKLADIELLPPVPKRARPLWTSAECTLVWSHVGSLMIGSPSKDIEPASFIASFDLDSTLTDTKSGKTFAQNDNDWKLWDPSVPEKLRSLHKEGFKIVIFSNQNGIAKGKTTAKSVQHKVNKLVEACGDIPFQVLMATADDEFRKPSTAMWRYFLNSMNGGVSVDMAASFYCGDAAGRLAGWKAGAKKDFSCGDRKFALNVKLNFYTPEELFLSEPAITTFSWDGIDPRDVLAKIKANPPTLLSDYTKPEKEMIIMVGLPASGKSTFTKRFFEAKGYVRINQDTLKTEAKCKKAAQEALEEGKSVVIDNTNPSKSKRATYLNLLDEDVTARCVWVRTPREICEHNNMFRERTQGVKHVPDIAYNMFKKNFEEPSTSEGFTEVITVDFCPFFKDEAEEQEFLQFT